MFTILHQRQQQQSLVNLYDTSSRALSTSPEKHVVFLYSRYGLLIMVTLLVVLGILFPWAGMQQGLFSGGSSLLSRWRENTLSEAARFVAKDGTIIVCAASHPYLPFLNNWLISITRQKHQDKVLVIAEDYATLYEVDERWPGHAVLVSPAPEAQTVHKFGSQGFFNFTSRKPRHLLHLLELGYNVMHNDVDMVWLDNPFPYLLGRHDVYFTDDMTTVKPLNHSHALPPPGKKGHTYICSCMIFLRPISGAKQVMRKWIDELQEQPWSILQKANDQPAFNWALNKTADQVDLYLLPNLHFHLVDYISRIKLGFRKPKSCTSLFATIILLALRKKSSAFKNSVYGLWMTMHAHEFPLGI